MYINPINHAVGTFENRSNAESALKKLREAGFDMNKVSIITRHGDAEDNLPSRGEKSSSHQVEGGTKTGAMAGAATGSIIGLVGGLGVIAIPGIGPIAELGVVLASGLLGSGVGAAGGGLVGALVAWGVPEDPARMYNNQVLQGYYLVMIEGTEAEINKAKAILERGEVRNWSVYTTP